jgi:homoserine kinase
VKKTPFVRAFAPATVANVGVGFDILGFAVSGIGELAEVSLLENDPRVVIDPVANFPGIPTDPKKNTAGAGLLRLIREKHLQHGFHVRLTKSIPIGSGLGGSAVSSVAAMVAASHWLDKKTKIAMTTDEIIDYALTGEEVASRSRHADNVAPCVTGGLVFVRSNPVLKVVPIPTPASLRCVLWLPNLMIKTNQARRLLKRALPLKTVVEQTANLTGFVLGCMNSDFELMALSLRDCMIEPQRSSLIPCFSALQSAALKSGALGCSISGSGPALFALARGDKHAKSIERALSRVSRENGIEVAGTWITPIAQRGAYVMR